MNTIQLWAPFRGSVAEVARVLRPAGRFVSYTHEWAIHRNSGMTTGGWIRHATAIFCECGLAETRSWQLYGSPALTSDGERVIAAQALIRRDSAAIS